MPTVSDKARKKIDDIIRDHHLAFMVEALGPTVVDKEDLDRLIKKGLVPKNLKTGQEMVSVPAAHTVGSIASQAGDEAVEKMDEDTFWKFIQLAPPKLLPHERDTVQATRRKMARHIEELGDAFKGEFARAVHEADTKLRGTELMSVQKEIARRHAKGESAASIVARLRKKYGAVKRDWLMVVQTELQNIIEQGKANAVLNSVPAGTDPRVFKRPRPDACRYCKVLYTVDGKRPRVFRLSELIANGSNEGRRARRPSLSGPNATEYKPVLGVVHPFCQCTLYVLPDGFSFDKDGNMKFVGVRKAMEDITEMTPLFRALLNHECES